MFGSQSNKELSQDIEKIRKDIACINNIHSWGIGYFKNEPVVQCNNCYKMHKPSQHTDGDR